MSTATHHIKTTARRLTEHDLDDIAARLDPRPVRPINKETR